MPAAIEISEAESGLRATASLLEEAAPSAVDLLKSWLSVPRRTRSIHAMWTGPEISSGLDGAEIPEGRRDATPPLENATLYPLAGDLVFLRFPPRVWGGSTAPIFDIGLFYGDHARLHFPVGYVPGSVFAKIPAEQIGALASACRAIRERGVVWIDWRLA